ncbi:hypothetical protein [Streptomyces albireticuli]|uniref:Secreted protein n=1 Tax=Streptomyces albireticuli TaxID=1940 RepID=A0A2A2D3R4_9ACTN|nr:hypothetical protein [Streptomyces albireticuli]MCD9144374.1 hypothetical protein [Streptomyces albireticuli]MCD9163563.1 hypothetical protein [Streptomyces albireticuli]MCD9193051.1 hypothetical protein [Streptomyces albireticuli]PAU46066.1 hypothetical protein CK936_26100 [Streptomyces albireticuli]
MRTRIRTSLALAASAAAVLAGGLAAAGPAAAQSGVTAASCQPKKTITVSGGKAEYTECRRTSNGKKQSSVILTLWDRAYCANPFARVLIGSYDVTFTHFDPYLSDESREFKTGWHNGADAKVWLDVRRTCHGGDLV